MTDGRALRLRKKRKMPPPAAPEPERELTEQREEQRTRHHTVMLRPSCLFVIPMTDTAIA
jgi:hypothetical protein